MNQTISTRGIWRVIGASSAGTLIEWYDFYIFGSLATVIANQFFPKTNPTAALLSTLATFAAGFIVRPFGALVFGRLGDLMGRKNTFLLTLVLMGGSTFAIGLVPGYEQIGFAAPLLVLLLRLVQGLALGGEYGGAATYVAEHAPPNRRGYFTSWIQTTATLGLFLSLGVILITRHAWLEHYTDNVGVSSSNLLGSTRVSEGVERHKTGGLAQLARAPALHAGGQRFESVILHRKGTKSGGTGETEHDRQTEDRQKAARAERRANKKFFI